MITKMGFVSCYCDMFFLASNLPPASVQFWRKYLSSVLSLTGTTIRYLHTFVCITPDNRDARRRMYGTETGFLYSSLRIVAWQRNESHSPFLSSPLCLISIPQRPGQPELFSHSLVANSSANTPLLPSAPSPLNPHPTYHP